MKKNKVCFAIMLLLFFVNCNVIKKKANNDVFITLIDKVTITGNTSWKHGKYNLKLNIRNDLDTFILSSFCIYCGNKSYKIKRKTIKDINFPYNDTLNLSRGGSIKKKRTERNYYEGLYPSFSSLPSKSSTNINFDFKLTEKSRVYIHTIYNPITDVETQIMITLPIYNKRKKPELKFTIKEM